MKKATILLVLLALPLACSHNQVSDVNSAASGVDEKKIRAVVQSHLDEVSDEGRVTKVETKSSTLNSPDVEKCAMEKVKEWHFPSPSKGEVADISYPFLFQIDE